MLLKELVDSRQKDLRLAVNTWREEHFKQLRDKEFNRYTIFLKPFKFHNQHNLTIVNVD